MKKLFATATSFIFFFLFIVAPLYGQNGTLSPTKAVLGIVDQIQENSLTIHDKKEGTTAAEITAKTKFIGRNKKLLKFSDIKQKDIVAIVGSESGKLTTNGAKLNPSGIRLKQALKIFVKEGSTSAQLKRRAVSGIIKSINGSIITLVHPVHQEQSFTLYVNNLTLIKMKGNNHPLLSNLTSGMRIAAVGELNDQGVLLAKLIHVIPGLAKGILNKHPISTPSATLTPGGTATPSVTLTSTPSATPIPAP